MGELVRFPDRALAIERARRERRELLERLERERLERALDRLAHDLRDDRDYQRFTVEAAFAAVHAGDLEHAAVHAVTMRHVGELDDYVELCELIKIVAAARRHCGLEPGT